MDDNSKGAGKRCSVDCIGTRKFFSARGFALNRILVPARQAHELDPEWRLNCGSRLLPASNFDVAMSVPVRTTSQGDFFQTC